jgi:5-dehydro-2-deoxygluconokinase
MSANKPTPRDGVGIEPSVSTQLDLITIGRVSVDLYGQQIGTRLEDVSTFIKGVGGCPANIAIGAARLGLKSALISRVGNEPMGRFVIEQLAREAVGTRCVRTDSQRLTSLVLLSVRNEDSFPLIFYRDNCADSALCEDDIDEAFVGSARAILVTGTHFSIAAAAKAQRKAIGIARAHGNKVILDIDYRPNLWGIGGHDSGERRYAASRKVTTVLASVLPDCDLIVGTEEELHIAGGAEDTLEAIRRIRAVSNGVIVCKRGARGCVVFSGRIPDRLEDGLVAVGKKISVYNVLGAGDAFLAGFLRGYLTGESHESSARLANACGAIAVSRLLCSSEFPTLTELNHYLVAGSPHETLREDDWLNHVHWATTRRAVPTTLMALAVDHRAQLEEMAKRLAVPLERISQFKLLAVEAAERVAEGRDGFGMLLDGTYGAPALERAARKNLWLARPIERPGSRPLEFHSAPSLATHLNEWPVNVTVKCLCFYHPDDPVALRVAQERELLRVAAVCRAQRRELLLEIIAGKNGELGEDTVARVLSRMYELQIRPDWWKLEPQPSAAAWKACADVITKHDPYCRGIVVLGLDAPMDDLSRSLRLAAAHSIVRGFAVGRTIFASAAEAWLSGRIGDEAAIDEMAERFTALVGLWSSARDPMLDEPKGSRA